MAVPTQMTSVCSSEDGRIEILVIDSDKPGYVLHTNQTETQTWADWGICDDNSSKLSMVVSALDDGGRLALGWLKDGQIWVSAANQPNGELSNAFALDSLGLEQLKLLLNLDGRLEFLALSTKNELWSIAQSQAGSWANLGIYNLTGTELQQIAGTRYGDGRLTAVALGKDKQVYRKEQNGPGNSWGQWMGLGGTDIQGIAAAANADGRLEVMVIGGNGSLYDYYQTTTGGWSGWQGVADGSFVGAPQLVSNADGRLEVFVSDNTGAIYHTFQTEKNGAWVPNAVLVDPNPNAKFADFAVTTLTDGRVVLLVQYLCDFYLYVQPEKNATTLTRITGPSTPCPPSISFHANPNPVQYNDTMTLSWDVEFDSGICANPAITLTGQPSGGAVVTLQPPPPNTAWTSPGQTTVRMTKDAKFILAAACSGSPLGVNKTINVTIAQPPPTAPDLVLKVSLIPALPPAGTPFTANVTVQNIGNEASMACDVLLSITSDGDVEPSTSMPVPAVLPGGAPVIPFKLTAGSAGTYTTLTWSIPDYLTTTPFVIPLSF